MLTAFVEMKHLLIGTRIISTVATMMGRLVLNITTATFLVVMEQKYHGEKNAGALVLKLQMKGYPLYLVTIK